MPCGADGAASPSVSAAYAILQGAAFNAGIDTAALEVRPGLGTRMSQNTNATGILEVRLMRARGAAAVLTSASERRRLA